MTKVSDSSNYCYYYANTEQYTNPVDSGPETNCNSILSWTYNLNENDLLGYNTSATNSLLSTQNESLFSQPQNLTFEEIPVKHIQSLDTPDPDRTVYSVASKSDFATTEPKAKGKRIRFSENQVSECFEKRSLKKKLSFYLFCLIELIIIRSSNWRDNLQRGNTQTLIKSRSFQVCLEFHFKQSQSGFKIEEPDSNAARTRSQKLE